MKFAPSLFTALTAPSLALAAGLLAFHALSAPRVDGGERKEAAPFDYAALTRALEPDRVIVYKEIDDRELELRIFLPEGWKPGDRRTCFHIIHGGGWTGMSPRRMYPIAAEFARRGMVAVCPQYRLHSKADGVTVFDCVRDARSSVRWVRAHADELGIDPSKVVVSGASAGGHLAAACAMFDGVDEAGEDLSQSCRPDAMALFFPVIDTSAEGYGQKKIGKRWRELSPAHQVRSGLPPTITFHGTGDKTTPFAGAKTFHEKMLAEGNRSELVVDEGGGHGYLIREEATFREAIAKSAKFLEEAGL